MSLKHLTALTLFFTLSFAGSAFAQAGGYGISIGEPGSAPGWNPEETQPMPTGHVVFHAYSGGTHTFSGELPYFNADGYCQYDGTATATVGGTIGNEAITLSFNMHGTQPTTSGYCTAIGQILSYTVSVKASSNARVSTRATVNGEPIQLDIQDGAYVSPWGPNPPDEQPCREIVSEDGLSVGCEIVGGDDMSTNPPCCKPLAITPGLPNITGVLNYAINDSEEAAPPAGAKAVFGFNTSAYVEPPAISFFQKLLNFFVFWR